MGLAEDTVEVRDQPEGVGREHHVDAFGPQEHQLGQVALVQLDPDLLPLRQPLGPGQLLGYMSALEKGVHGADAVVREQALLLEIPNPEFDKLYFGASPASTKLQRVIQKSLLASLGQTNRHLTRLINLARLRGAEKEGDALEAARGGQIVSAASPDPGS